MPTAHRCLTLLALISMSSCTGNVAAPSDSSLASAVQGEWVAEQTVPGNFLGFTLQAADATVTGTGVFAGEAGPSGTVAIVGAATQSTLTLRFTYTATVPAPATSVARFVGSLDASDRLVGSFKYGPEAGQQPEYPIVFRRKAPLSQ